MSRSPETHLVVLRDDGSVRARIDIAAAGSDRFRYLDLLRAKDRIAVTAGNGSVAFYDLDGRLLTSLPPDRSVQRAVWIGTAGAWMVVSSAPSARFHRPDGTLALEVAGRPSDRIRRAACSPRSWSRRRTAAWRSGARTAASSERSRSRAPPGTSPRGRASPSSSTTAS
jgi:hypothetical protein